MIPGSILPMGDCYGWANLLLHVFARAIPSLTGYDVCMADLRFLAFEYVIRASI